MVHMVAYIASDHDIKEKNVLHRNFIVYVACDTGFSTSSISPHEIHAKGRI